jgi:N-acetylated-alpha-linked acidic dipeptidase
MTRALFFVALVGLVALSQRPPQAPFGFTADGARQYGPIERRFLTLPEPGKIRDAHRYLTAAPHIAGSRRDRELAEWTRDQFTSFGLEDVEITTHDVLLPWPEETSVEMTAPRAWRASMREDPIDGDPYTAITPEEAGLPYHAYSASGDVTAPVVYAGSGNPADYDKLASLGIDVKGKIALVRYSVPYSYRGFKALTAQQRGAAGILIYSDPADDGFAKGKVYPHGPWGPESHIQRGGIVYDFMVPGDPLTPGWASLPGARRQDRSESISLPSIISAPLSYKDARGILEVIGGPEAPREWKGALPITYRVGGGPAVVRLRVRSDDRVRPIWTVTGRIRGAEDADAVVVVGNHRDAWVYGGVDPSSGSAALVELARTVGELKRGGWRPKRSILFASWDAEEFTLTSSTEWGEQHEAELRKNAVAYLNVDSAASGSHLAVAAVPALNRVITEAAQTVRDPRTRIPLAAVARDRRQQGSLPTGGGAELVNNRLGSGSDYTVFLNFLGVPVADMSFDGPYGVYHSIYDNHLWVDRIGDPGFRYHTALVQLWGIVALRLAEADALPLDYEAYAARIREFARDVARESPAADPALTPLAEPAAAFEAAASALNAARAAALASGDAAALATVNRRLMDTERALLDPAGLRDRPWYRHLVYAPKFTYAPEVLPGVAEAARAGDAARTALEVQRLGAALRRAAGVLSGAASSSSAK